MKSYTWDDFYEKFYGWSDSTQISRISQLTTFGSHDEVAEIVQMYYDEKAASRLAKKAMDAGVRFTPAEIVEMQGSVNKECMNQMVTTALGDFTQEQVEELVYSMDDDIYAKLEKRYCHYDENDNDVAAVESSEETSKQKKPGKLFGFLAFASMGAGADSQKKVPKFRVGDHVRVRYRGQEGTVIDINGGLYMVSLSDGAMVDSYPESALERAW